MTVLTQEQRDAFWRDGYLMVEDAVTPAQLAALKAEIAGWVEQSRAHATPFGPPTIDGRPRFDMGAEHSAEKPALRRINNPSDISDAYREVMLDAAHGRHGGRPDRAGREIPPLQDQPEAFGSADRGQLPSGFRLHAAHQRRHRDGAAVPRRCRRKQWLPHRRAGLAQGAGPVAVRGRSLHRRRRGRRGEEGARRIDSVPGQGRQRLPDAHAPAARLGRQRRRQVARPLHLRLYGRRRGADRPQPDAQSERGSHRARQGGPLRPPQGRAGRTAEAAQDRVVLHRAGPGFQAGGRVSDPLPAITEAQATGEIADLFADIRATVGVRVVNLVWRHLATMEGALPWAWAAVKPLYLDGLPDAAMAAFHRDDGGPEAGLAGRRRARQRRCRAGELRPFQHDQPVRTRRPARLAERRSGARGHDRAGTAQAGARPATAQARLRGGR